MEYIKSIDSLQKSVSRYQTIVMAMAALLAITIIGVPLTLKNGPYVVVDNESVFKVLKSEPWTLSTSRMESFVRFFLNNRFEWNEKTFERNKELLKTSTTKPVFEGLRNSLAAFSVLAQNQKASSSYIFEGFAFSNAQKKIEARIIRVIKIDKSVMATPVTVRMSFSESAINHLNPYGLTVNGLIERDGTNEAQTEASR